MGLGGVEVAYNPNYIVALQVDHGGVVWVGTWGGGLASFDGRIWRNYTVADGLPSNHVFSLYESRAGALWIGTSHGLAVREKDTYRVLTTHDGLFSDVVFSMTETRDGNVWIGGFGGVTTLFGSP